MKILLTNPIWPNEIQMGKFSNIKPSKFPYGYASILGYFRDYGPKIFHVDFIDSDILSEQDFYEKIKDGNYDLVGLSTFTFSIKRVYQTADKIRTILPNCKIVVGGVHATLFPERTLKESKSIDYVIVYEGELPLLKLCEELNKGKYYVLSDVPNLFYRDGGGTVLSNEVTTYLTEEQFPRADFTKFKMENYDCAPPLFKYLPTPNLIASRGCPFKCSFCAQSQLLGKKVRYKIVEQVISEFLELKERINARGIWFQDSIFTINKRWIYKFCDEIRKLGFKVPWGCFTRVDCVDENLLKKMREAGCWQIAYGIESGNQRSLDSMRKGITVEKSYEVVEMTKRLGIKVYASFILAWPGEDLDDVYNTIKFAKTLRPNTAIFHTPCPYPKTELFDLCVAEGSIRSEISFDEYQDGMSSMLSKLIYINPKIGERMMYKIVPAAYRRFYLSRAGISHIMTYRTFDQIRTLIPKAKTFLKIHY